MKSMQLLLAIAFAFALTLGGVPQPAEAGLCKKLGFSNKCVVRRDIKKNAINGSRVANESLTGADMLNGSLTGADVADSSLTEVDIANEGGANFSTSSNSFILTGLVVVAASVTITAPSAGVVIVNASGWFDLTNTDSGDAVCTLSTNTSLGSPFVRATGSFSNFPLALTGGFEVNAGSNIFNLVCSSSSNTLVVVLPGNMTAMFFPTRYGP